jgi:type IV secretion system protein VirB1
MEAFLDLAQRCAPQVQVEVLAAVASVESGLNPYAVRINSDHPLKAQPTTKAEAIEVAAALVSAGKDVDLGLGGVNVSDLRRLGLSIAEAFDSCRSLNATGHLLNGYYRAAMRSGASPAEAERLMLVS